MRLMEEYEEYKEYREYGCNDYISPLEAFEDDEYLYEEWRMNN